MGDGEHNEPGSSWISREYKKKRDTTKRDKVVSDWCLEHKCKLCGCGGELKQTRKGSMRVKCSDCGTKFQLKKNNTI